MTETDEVVAAARRIVLGDDSTQAASALERAIIDAHPFEQDYDDLLEVLAMCAPALGAPYFDHGQLCELITRSGIMKSGVERT